MNFLDDYLLPENPENAEGIADGGVPIQLAGASMTASRLESQKIPQPGQRALVRHDGRSVVIFNVGGHLHAIEDECPHAGAALCTGRLDGHLIQCSAHGLRFDLRTGAMPGNPGLRVPVYRIHAQGDAFVLERTAAGSDDQNPSPQGQP
jgi:3-phenylpropionate/trans-cinnamate dioxygenase ferredoxin component